MNTTKTVHIYFLLDVSGSMQSIASDVIGGFNAFRSEQLATCREAGIEALLTLVQFDSNNPHDVVAAAQSMEDVAELSAATYRPRGGTPLYDAIGALVADASIRAEQSDRPEEIMFVIFTDGQENESREYNRASVFQLIAQREARGWTFVFLGANQDSYLEGAGIGINARSTQNFAASPQGTEAAFTSLSRGMSKEIRKVARREVRHVDDFFEGDKGAEEHLRSQR